MSLKLKSALRQFRAILAFFLTFFYLLSKKRVDNNLFFLYIRAYLYTYGLKILTFLNYCQNKIIDNNLFYSYNKGVVNATN